MAARLRNGSGASVLDLDVTPRGDFAKFDPDQPRVPANSGPESGRWTRGDGPGGTNAAIAAGIALRAAPLLAPELGAVTMSALTALAGVVGFAAVAGVLFVPWQNSVSSSGPLPGKSGNSYSSDHDEGLLRVLDATGKVLAAGHKDGSGVFYDADTGVPFAREVMARGCSMIPRRWAAASPIQERAPRRAHFWTTMSRSSARKRDRTSLDRRLRPSAQRNTKKDQPDDQPIVTTGIWFGDEPYQPFDRQMGPL